MDRSLVFRHEDFDYVRAWQAPYSFHARVEWPIDVMEFDWYWAENEQRHPACAHTPEHWQP